MPVKAQFVGAGGVGTTNPTGIRSGLLILICQTGQGGAPEPPVYKLRLLSPVNPSIARGVVISVVNVASFGNGRLSSSPQAADPCKFGSDLGANENRRVVNDMKTIRLIHRDFMLLTSAFVHVSDESVEFVRASQLVVMLFLLS